MDLEKGLLVSAAFRRGENLPFWKWLLYNQILRRSQKMSMLSHADEHIIDRFLKNLEEVSLFLEILVTHNSPPHFVSVWYANGDRTNAISLSLSLSLSQADVFTAWVPEEEPDVQRPQSSDPNHIQEIEVDEDGNPLDILEQLDKQPRADAELEAIEVKYEWDADDGSAYGTSHDPSRATTAHRSAYDSAAPGDEEEQGWGQKQASDEQKQEQKEKKGGLSSLFRTKK